MAKNQTARVRPDLLALDREAYIAAQALGDYAPANAAYVKTAMTACFTAMAAAQETEIKAEQALAAARDNSVSAEWGFHNLVLGVKTQVAAQYGPDSNELQSLGLKKKSEHKAPRRKKGVAG
jgi:hypothetical protein